MAKKAINRKIREYLLQNPHLLNQNYNDTAAKFNVTREVVRHICRFIRNDQNITTDSVTILPSTNNSKFDNKGDKAEYTFNTDKQIRSLEDLIKACDIDLLSWEVERYVCNKWEVGARDASGEVKVTPLFQVKVWLKNRSEAKDFSNRFEEFLKEYKPAKIFKPKVDKNKKLSDALLVINKQDEHLNKYDMHGDNDFQYRFSNVYDKVNIILNQAKLSNNLDKILYVVGSDEFNSEYNKATTKGTPQENIHTFHNGFQLICDYEISMIEQLLEFSNDIEVMYVQGNHDEYVGWHMIHWLMAHFRNESRVKFDIDPTPTKYMKYDNTALMFNHGDAVKPAKLAARFPMGFKEHWSSCDNYIIITGDKHHEHSLDFNGILFYQIPALSTAKSQWDLKNEHTSSKAELTAFLIEKKKGRTNIFKQPL